MTMNSEILRREIHIGETHAVLIGETRFMETAEKLVREARRQLDVYIARQPEFKTSLVPLPLLPGAPDLVRRMAEATARFGLGPMAAVAGGIAQLTVENLRAAGAGYCVMDNGGDVVFVCDRPLTVGIYTGKSTVRDIALRFPVDSGIRSVCTSSATVGPSLSLGRADAATVIAADGFLADAAATALGNRIRKTGRAELKKALESMLFPGITGLLAVAGNHLALAGELPELVSLPLDENLIAKG